MLKFDATALSARLSFLSRRKQLAFLLLLCERMLPGFQKFGSDTGFNVSPYRECLDKGWGTPNHQALAMGMEESSENCLEQPPDTEEFDHYLTSTALNAALSIEALISFLSDHSIDHIVEAADWARDTVALYVQSSASVAPLTLSSETVMTHPLMQQELHREAEDLDFLMTLSNDLDPNAVQLLKERSRKTPGLLPL